MSAVTLTDAEREALQAVFAGWSTMPAALLPAVEQILVGRIAGADR